jgi:hypothetical protein
MLNETTSAKRHYFLCRWCVAEPQTPPSDKEIMGCFESLLAVLTRIDRETRDRLSNAACASCVYMSTATIKNLAV